MGPISERRPLGHQPPWGRPRVIAASSAARSAPVCPPEIIFKVKGAGVGMIELGSAIRSDGVFERGWDYLFDLCAPWDSNPEPKD